MASFLRSSQGRKALARGVLALALRPVDGVLGMAMQPGPAVAEPRPVFIIGPPRSGSTLLYQYAVQVLDVHYTSVLWNMLPRSGFALVRGKRPPREDFRAFYGNSRYALGPCEGGNIFSLWLKTGETHHLAAIPPRARDSFRAGVARIEAQYGRPALFKNIRHCVQIGALAQAFPEAGFIRIHRDPVMVVEGVLAGNRDLTDGPDQTFTVKPEQWPSLSGLDRVSQAIEQVYHLEAGMERDLSRLDGTRVVRCAYEDLCKSPYGLVTGIAAKLAWLPLRPDIGLETRNRRFAAKVTPGLDAAAIRQARTRLAEFEALHRRVLARECGEAVS